MSRRSLFVLGMLILFTAMGSAAGSDEPYPSKPIICVIPFPGGGATDITTRALCSVISQYIGQPFIPNPKGGGGGAVGVYEMVKSKPDGYTVLCAGNSLVMPELYAHFNKAPYTYKDSTAVCQWAGFIPTIAVRKDAPWNTLKEFMEEAKNKPMKFGGPGTRTTNYILGLALAKKYGTKMGGLPFKGDGEVVTALLGGHVDMGMLMTASVKAQFDAGTLRVLAVGYDTRLPDFPGVPTIKEQGYDVGFDAMFMGMYAPSKTPPGRIKVLADSVKKVTEDETFLSMMNKFSMPVLYADTETYGEKLIRIQKALTKAFMDAGLNPTPID